MPALTQPHVFVFHSIIEAHKQNTHMMFSFPNPGADRWQNGADVIVDYNTADPLIRWDSYQNICDGEGTTTTPH